MNETNMKDDRMSTTDESNLVAPCGLHCGRCASYQAKYDPAVMEFLVSLGMNRDKLPCDGCRQIEGKCLFVGLPKETWPNGPSTGPCETYTCAVEHGVDFCFECGEFPCVKLHPCADMADVAPHNTKVFNLCYIKHHGLNEFLGKDSEKEFPGLFLQRYFLGKMVTGKGPQVEESEITARIAALGEAVREKIEKKSTKG
jgi:hypothetical protein